MAQPKAAGCSGFLELEVGNTVESLQGLMETQRELVQHQIAELQRIVVLQCRLTGINPLSQEMAAGALSIKIGRRPRDLLNPKAIKCLQGIFAIKDTIMKREAREISALCGATITQVREFFSGQRSRVRRFVRQSMDKENNMQMSNTFEDSDQNSTKQSSCLTEMLHSESEVGNRVAVKDLYKLPNDDILGERESFDSNFIKRFFSLMRKESTFSGQVQLLERILQIHDQTVLCWFVTKGGIPILAKWLTLASVEEQTTVLHVLFKVLCHLPLHKALPVQMSTVLQTVNKLRFYRTSDISNRARIVLARWSKLFGRSQSGRKAVSSSSQVHAQKGGLQRQYDTPTNKRASELSREETDNNNKRTKIGSIEDPRECSKMKGARSFIGIGSTRQQKLLQGCLLNMGSSEGSKKRPAHSVPLDQTKERRKVRLVEEPMPGMSRRKVKAGGTVSKSCSRPLSTDDIQKAKRQAYLLQNRYGKFDVSKLDDDHLEKTKPSESAVGEDYNKASCSKTSPPESSISEVTSHGSQHATEAASDSFAINRDFVEEMGKHIITENSSLTESIQIEEIQILWITPPEMIIDHVWRFASGEESKEVEFQCERVKREKEAVYLNEESIPSDPKEPWDIELDYDDSLTPEIPIEPIVTDDSTKVVSLGNYERQQLTEIVNDVKIEGSTRLYNHFVGISNDKTCSSMHDPVGTMEVSSCTDSNSDPLITSLKQVTTSTNEDPVPDLELLAVLLKNPDLVFALTSEQGARFSKEETVALLDILKASSTRQEISCTASNFTSNKEDCSSSTGSANAEVIKQEEQMKDSISSASVIQSFKGLAEQMSTNAVVSSVYISQSSHHASTNSCYGGEHRKSNENGQVPDLGLQITQNLPLHTHDSTSEAFTFSQDNQEVLIREPQEQLRRTENNSSQQDKVRLPPVIPRVQPVFIPNKDLRPDIVKTSGPSQLPTWPVATVQNQSNDGNTKNYGFGVSSFNSMIIEHGLLKTNRRVTSGATVIAHPALKQSPLKGTSGPVSGMIPVGQPTKQNMVQGSASNRQSFPGQSSVQQGHIRAPIAQVIPAVLVTESMQASSSNNSGCSQGNFLERRDHNPSCSSGFVSCGAFNDKGNPGSLDRIRSLVMDFGRDTGRDHTKNGCLPSQQGHVPRLDNLYPPPSYPNNNLPPVLPNLSRPDLVERVHPKPPPSNYSQRNITKAPMISPRNIWTPDARGEHPYFHQAQNPSHSTSESGHSNLQGNFRPKSPWAWNGRSGSSREGR